MVRLLNIPSRFSFRDTTQIGAIYFPSQPDRRKKSRKKAKETNSMKAQIKKIFDYMSQGLS